MLSNLCPVCHGKKPLRVRDGGLCDCSSGTNGEQVETVEKGGDELRSALPLYV
jgi:hypothetical protein